MILEFLGGYFANSLAIMTDAAHLLTDLCSFIISIYSIMLSKQQKDKHFTFGYHRAQIIGAMLSTLIIWVLSIFLLIESTHKMFYSHHEVNSQIMVISSLIALVFNLIMAYILHSGGVKLL